MPNVLNTRMVEVAHVPVWTKRDPARTKPRTCRVCGAEESNHNGD